MTASITFCSDIPSLELGWPVPSPVYSTAHSVAVGVASTLSSACPAGSNLVQVHAVTTCRLRIGSAPTAVSTDMVVGAGQTLYLPCSEGEQVAIIQV